MPIEPVAPIHGLSVTGVEPLDAVPVSRDSGEAFGSVLGGTVDNLRALQSESSALATQAITGDLNDIHDAMIASTRASVTLELVAAVRNKGVEAFNEIMRMQA